MKSHLTCTGALVLAAWSGAAMAGTASYTRTWVAALTHNEYVTAQGYKHGPNTKHCVALTDDGSAGYQHSGYAIVDGQYDGQFQVLNGTILIFVDIIGSGEEPASWVFSTTASDGAIGAKGAFAYIQGGESYDSADAAFTTTGGC